MRIEAECWAGGMLFICEKDCKRNELLPFRPEEIHVKQLQDLVRKS